MKLNELHPDARVWQIYAVNYSEHGDCQGNTKTIINHFGAQIAVSGLKALYAFCEGLGYDDGNIGQFEQINGFSLLPVCSESDCLPVGLMIFNEDR